MYGKAVQIHMLLAFAYEVPKGGYALALCTVGCKPILEYEPEFTRLEELETTMNEIAPLSHWSDSLFQSLVESYATAN